MGRSFTRIRLSNFQIILIGFLFVILTGALLLMLPIASNSRSVTPFLDTLFTATSAVCVTGLVVVDTAVHWSIFGQIIILLLIQIGGMGVVTLAAAFTILAGKRFGLSQKSIMLDSLSGTSLGGIVELTKFIIIGTLITEFLGAVIMLPVYCSDFGPRGIWYAVFHSVSAFCNAGFDLLGTLDAQFVSLTKYAGDPIISITIPMLIIIGGIGFLTWEDIVKKRFHFSRYRLHSKIILIATLVLVLVPSVYFFIFEFSDAPIGERILLSFFQSVTPRTAGFNTADLTKISDSGIYIMTILMLIGGASGSTAGGMKVSTAVITVTTMISVFKKKNDVEIGKRRVDVLTIKNAVAIFMMYISLFILASLTISILEELPLLTCFYEVASALATVGLTLGITPGLSAASKIILILLMFIGRVGGLTIIYAATGHGSQARAKLPTEDLPTG